MPAPLYGLTSTLLSDGASRYRQLLTNNKYIEIGVYDQLKGDDLYIAYFHGSEMGYIKLFIYAR